MLYPSCFFCSQKIYGADHICGRIPIDKAIAMQNHYLHLGLSHDLGRGPGSRPMQAAPIFSSFPHSGHLKRFRVSVSIIVTGSSWLRQMGYLSFIALSAFLKAASPDNFLRIHSLIHPGHFHIQRKERTPRISLICTTNTPLRGVSL